MWMINAAETVCGRNKGPKRHKETGDGMKMFHLQNLLASEVPPLWSQGVVNPVKVAHYVIWSRRIYSLCCVGVCRGLGPHDLEY